MAVHRCGCIARLPSLPSCSIFVIVRLHSSPPPSSLPRLYLCSFVVVVVALSSLRCSSSSSSSLSSSLLSEFNHCDNNAFRKEPQQISCHWHYCSSDFECFCVKAAVATLQRFFLCWPSIATTTTTTTTTTTAAAFAATQCCVRRRDGGEGTKQLDCTLQNALETCEKPSGREGGQRNL